MKRKAIVIIGIVVILIALIVGMIIYMNNHKLEKQAIKDIEQFTDFVINGGTSEELSKVLGYKEIQPINIISGKDSYLSFFPEENVISQNNLTKYVEANKKYIDNLEKEVKNNFEYDLEKKSSTKEEIVIEVDYKRYCFSVYVTDLDILQSKILEKAGVSDEVSRYKAKIVAMKILDNKLDVYKSKKHLTTTVVYKEDKDNEVKDSFNSYFLKLGGFSGVDTNIEKLKKSSSERVNGYLEEAIENGIIDGTNLLSI